MDSQARLPPCRSPTKPRGSGERASRAAGCQRGAPQLGRPASHFARGFILGCSVRIVLSSAYSHRQHGRRWGPAHRSAAPGAQCLSAKCRAHNRAACLRARATACPWGSRHPRSSDGVHTSQQRAPRQPKEWIIFPCPEHSQPRAPQRSGCRRPAAQNSAPRPPVPHVLRAAAHCRPCSGSGHQPQRLLPVSHTRLARAPLPGARTARPQVLTRSHHHAAATSTAASHVVAADRTAM